MFRFFYSRVVLAGVFIAALASCQGGEHAEMIEEMKQQQSKGRAAAAAYLEAEVYPITPKIGSFCAAAAEGQPQAPTVFTSAGFTVGQMGLRPFYDKDKQFEFSRTGVSVRHEQSGCLILLPNNHTVDLGKFLAGIRSGISSRGYTISAGSGGQVATKGDMRILLKTDVKGTTAVSAIHIKIRKL